MAVTIHFLQGNDVNIQHHYSGKGYRDDILIQIDQTYYEIYFYEENAIRYETVDDAFFSMPGLIVLTAIEHDKIIKSITHLYEIGYFNWFKGFDEMQYEKTFMSKWYLNEMSPFDKNELSSLVIIADM
ncbi:MAG: hypothetical protein K0S32_4553 [Bacteroidetes bacterium]|jgi:hypothetical protein|nr:hypothetical protein [Bacteroidota bacterium]